MRLIKVQLLFHLNNGEINLKKILKLAPSILSADFSVLKNEINSVANADYLHIDVMDGMFVENISLGIPVIKSIRKVTDLIFDVHLMIDEPRRYIKQFANAGADIITIHAEASDDLKGDLKMIKSFNKKAGVAIKPNTSLDAINDVLDLADMFLIMSVEPGFGGQKLIDFTLQKALSLSKIVCDKDIEMDGGINLENVESVLKSGVNVIVVGSAIFNCDDRNKKINRFREKFMEYENQA